MSKHFDDKGQPTPEAAPFFFYPEGSDIPEPTPEHEARWQAVAEHVANFDGSLILESLINGWTVEETIAQGLEDQSEQMEYARAMSEDFEFQLDHDMSMNH
jgi:hypothetical protein